jgi:hypothetical protein
MDQFANVAFKQFKERLRDHRKQVSENQIRAAKELDALEHGRGLFPRQTVNQQGKLVFNLHPAKLLLCAMLKQEITSERLHRSYSSQTYPTRCLSLTSSGIESIRKLAVPNLSII